MKIRHEQLTARLAQTFPAFACIFGDEPLLQLEAETALRQQAKVYEFSERIKVTPQSASDWEQLLSAYYEQSLFAERTLFECYVGNGKIGKPGSTAIRKCLEQPAADKALLLIGDKWEAAISQSSWMKAFDKSGWVVQVYKLPPDQYPAWIKQRLGPKQTIHDDALSLLVEYTQGNLLATHQAVNLLITLAEGQAIDAALVKQAIAVDSKANLFELIDTILGGKQLKAGRILMQLKQAGNDPILIIWAMAKQVRELLQMQQQLDQGKPIAAVLSQFRVWPSKKTLISRAVSKGSVKHWQEGLESLLAADKIVKGVTKGDIWNNLLQLSMRLSRAVAS